MPPPKRNKNKVFFKGKQTPEKRNLAAEFLAKKKTMKETALKQNGKYKTLCLTMIVKNESRIIVRLFESLVGVIDMISITETGCADNTVQLIKEYGKKHNIPTVVHFYQFNGFGKSRAMSVRNSMMAFPEADYYFLSDADFEWEVDGKIFDKRLFYMDIYSVIQYSEASQYDNVRILANTHDWKCYGVTHEYWTSKFGKEQCTRALISGLRIHDINDGGAKADKYERDERLLRGGIIYESDKYELLISNKDQYYFSKIYKLIFYAKTNLYRSDKLEFVIDGKSLETEVKPASYHRFKLEKFLRKVYKKKFEKNFPEEFEIEERERKERKGETVKRFKFDEKKLEKQREQKQKETNKKNRNNSLNNNAIIPGKKGGQVVKNPNKSVIVKQTDMVNTAILNGNIKRKNNTLSSMVQISKGIRTSATPKFDLYIKAKAQKLIDYINDESASIAKREGTGGKLIFNFDVPVHNVLKSKIEKIIGKGVFEHEHESRVEHKNFMIGRYKYYLGQTLKDLGKYEDSINIHRERIAHKVGQDTETYYSYFLIAQNYTFIYNDYKNSTYFIKRIERIQLEKWNEEMGITVKEEDKEIRLNEWQESIVKKYITDNPEFAGILAMSDEDIMKAGEEMNELKGKEIKNKDQMTEEQIKQLEDDFDMGIGMVVEESNEMNREQKLRIITQMKLNKVKEIMKKLVVTIHEAFLTAYTYRNRRIEPIYYLVKFYRELGRNKGSYKYRKLAFDLILEYQNKGWFDKTEYFVEYACYDWKFDFEMSVVGFYVDIEMGRLAQKRLVARLHELPKDIQELIKSNSQYYL